MISTAFISALFPLDKGEKTGREVENLSVFARLYGYIRFFHPSDEAAGIDWDKFALYGTAKVKNAKNSRELKGILEELFLPIAPTIQIYHTGVKPKTFDSKPPKNVEDLHLVAWQHYGVDLKYRSNIYQSFRLGRFEIPQSALNGICLFFLDVKYKGKRFKLTAYAKAEVTGEKNGGYIYINALAPSGKPIFDDFMRDRPIRQNEWKKYEITGEFNQDPYYLQFGAELVGVGKMWADDFHFYLAEKDGDWEEVSLSNPNFDEVKPDNRPVEWAYRKKSETNYEYTVVKDGDNNVLQIQNAAGYIPGMLFPQYPKVGEVINKELGGGLSCQVPLALWSDKNGTLGKDDKHPLEPLTAELNKIDLTGMTAESESLRLGNIVTAWNVFQHFYPYFDVIDTDWDKVLTGTLGEVLMNKTSNDYYDSFRKMVAKLQDGHGYIYYKPKPAPGGLPIKVEWIENQVVITASGTPLLKKGDIIHRIDGISGEKALLNAEQYVSGSSQLRRFRALNQYGSGTRGSMAKLTVLRNNETVHVKIQREKEKRRFFFNRISEFEFPDIKELAEDIYYVNLNTTGPEEYKKVIDRLADAKGIIFDSRWDGGEKYPQVRINPISHIIPHLIDDEVQTARWNIPNVIYPDRRDLSYSKSRWPVKPKAPRFKAKVVFITEPFVVSKDETYMGIIEHYKLAEIVGESTAGCNGNANFINLPGGFRIMWTGMKVLKHDGSQHHLIGILPTVPVKRTIKAVRDGRDEYLEKAIEIIKKSKKTGTGAKNTEDTARKNYEQAKKNFDADPSEENTIWLGRRTAYLGKYKEAIEIYTKGLQKYPVSYKLYRHRGHRYITTRKFKKAIKDFKKAVKLVKGIPLEVEPDGIPNAANIPVSNTQFNIRYHLGLAYYLTGDFEQAASAYRECLKWCNNDDTLVAASHWLYMTFRRMNNKAAAERLLVPVKEKMKIIEDQDYHALLLMYKGLKTPVSLLKTIKASGTDTGLSSATVGYGVGNWYYYNGHSEKAKEIFKNILAGKNRAAFGFIAAEVDYNKMY
jgi:tetratricopeptide (TPR) repeat protein